MIYFDNAATTKPLDEIFEQTDWLRLYGNPSSLHIMGLEAERAVKQSRFCISQMLGCREDEVLFTSGGTESNNLAIFGISMANKRQSGHIITTKAEHPSGLAAFKELERQGFSVDYVGLDKDGLVNKDELKSLIRPETILVSIMQVNNETGVLEDTEAIATLTKQQNPNIFFYVDGVQGFGKHRLSLKMVDGYGLSAHKIHGLKGSGALYVKHGARLRPLFYGGGQNTKLRPGTENTWGIFALALAAKKCADNIDAHLAHVGALKKFFIENITEEPDVIINGHTTKTSPYIANVSFLGIPGEVMLQALSAEGVFVSTGAACKKTSEKHVLHAYSQPEEVVQSAVRFSFSNDNTLEEVELCLNILKKQLKMLRKFKKRVGKLL